MASEKEFKSMMNSEVSSMNILLSTKAKKTALTLSEFIDFALLQGASKESIKQSLIQDLEEGGRIFGEFRNAIRATSNGIIHRMRDTAQFSEDEVGELKYRWVAVLVNTCPDCIDRHGQEKSMTEWEIEGLPRAGFTVCKENCRCLLLPANTTILEPVRRNIRV